MCPRCFESTVVYPWFRGQLWSSSAEVLCIQILDQPEQFMDSKCSPSLASLMYCTNFYLENQNTKNGELCHECGKKSLLACWPFQNVIQATFIACICLWVPVHGYKGEIKCFETLVGSLRNAHALAPIVESWTLSEVSLQDNDWTKPNIMALPITPTFPHR